MDSMKDAWEKAKQEIRRKAEERNELIESNLEDLQIPERIILDPPKGLLRKPGESTRAHAQRIRQAAVNGDDAARAEYYRMTGAVNDGKSFTNYDQDGVPKEGYELSVEEESVNEIERKEIGE